MTDAGVAEVVAALPQLQGLDAEGCAAISGETVREIASFLTALMSLIISGVRMMIKDALTVLTELRVLSIVGVLGNDLDLDISDLTAMPHLSELNLNNNVIRGQLPESLAALTGLTALDLHEVSMIREEGAIVIARALTRLQRLDLGGGGWSEEDVALSDRFVMTISTSLTALTHLNLITAA